ncbi:hypothetical protein LWI29_014658 [Acer saccharum]|uniref:Uncharacterized protein n=1 Tax=Acer saccharum TaxID=4024 RepID=A0AA39SVL5_ACESA|nr:hypothetical protein LWI29_014658 [Acer saccharum]
MMPNMMRIKKHHQRIHCIFQLGQLQGPRGSKKQLIGAESELLKSKFGPHEDQIWAELHGPLQSAYELQSQVEQLTVPLDLKSKSTSIIFGCTGDQACTPPPMMKCKSTLSPVMSSFEYKSTTGSNEFVPSGFPVDESKTPPSIRKSIFPQSPLATAGKKSANRSNHGDYAKDEKVHCPTVVTAEEDVMGCSTNINSALCPCSNEINPQDLLLRLHMMTIHCTLLI